MKKDIMSLQRKKTLTIEENQYIVEFPNVGQIIDIESNKMLYSNGRYKELVTSSGLLLVSYSLDLIDMAATFGVLIPGLVKDLRAKSIFELDPIATKKIIKVYKEDFLPWYIEFIQLINEKDEVIEELVEEEDAEKDQDKAPE